METGQEAAASVVVGSKGLTSQLDYTEPSCWVHCVGESGTTAGQTQGLG